uniref:R13L1/DRL21-like LRR repeat region domain-containing protein n=1 Tax=Oryza glumipatula TaxID=40148 RepID=A0A0E0AUS1_9ORYZ
MVQAERTKNWRKSRQAEWISVRYVIILEGLYPPSQLTELEIYSYGGVKYPKRLADKQPDKFDTILLDIFGRCDELPTRLVRDQIREEDYSLFLFPTSVKRLIITDCAITDTVLQNYLTNSASLTWLFLSGLPSITSIPSEVMKSLTMLQELFIIGCAQCPNLTIALQEDEKLRVLRGLTTDDIHLVPPLSPENLANLTCLQELRLQNCKNTMSLPTLLVSLRGLILNACDQSFVKSCQKVGHHPNYQKIAHVPSISISS